MQFQGGIFLQSKPAREYLLVVQASCSLGTMIPPLANSDFDLHFESLVLAYSSLPTGIPAIAALQRYYPWLSAVLNPSGLFVAASIDDFPFLRCFGISKGQVRMVLSVNVGAVTRVTVAIDAPVKIGAFEGATLFAFVDFTPILKLGFQFDMRVTLPGATAVSTFAMQVSITPITLQLAGSIAASPAPFEGPPAWPNAFWINGFDIYAVGLTMGINIQTGLPNTLGALGVLGLRNIAY